VESSLRVFDITFSIHVFSQSLGALLCLTLAACQPSSTRNLPSPDPATQTSSPTVTASPQPQFSDSLPSPSRLAQAPAQTPRPHAIFQPILPALTSQTQVPVLLPTEIPDADEANTLYAILESATASDYQILLAFTEDCNGGTACRFGTISGQAASEAAASTGQSVTLRDGIPGQFVEATCGANCSDAILTWEQDGYRYTLGIKAGNEATLIEMANSAIANGTH
jgi:hypothetical protein